MNESEYQKAFEQIVADPALTDLEKLVQAFDLTTRHFIDHHGHEAELARTLGDQERVVRAEIMAGMLKTSRSMFSHCYLRITGQREKLWDE